MVSAHGHRFLQILRDSGSSSCCGHIQPIVWNNEFAKLVLFYKEKLEPYPDKDLEKLVPAAAWETVKNNEHKQSLAPLFMTPVDSNFLSRIDKGDRWYLPRNRRGEKMLGVLVKDVAKELGLPGLYTNTSGRVTLSCTLANNSVPDTIAMSFTGHRSVQAYRSYASRNDAGMTLGVSDLVNGGLLPGSAPPLSDSVSEASDTPRHGLELLQIEDSNSPHATTGFPLQPQLQDVGPAPAQALMVDQDDGYDEEAIRAHEQRYANDNGIMEYALNPAGDNWSHGGNHGHYPGEDIWDGDANDYPDEGTWAGDAAINPADIPDGNDASFDYGPDDYTDGAFEAVAAAPRAAPLRPVSSNALVAAAPRAVPLRPVSSNALVARGATRPPLPPQAKRPRVNPMYVVGPVPPPAPPPEENPRPTTLTPIQQFFEMGQRSGLFENGVLYIGGGAAPR